MSLGTPQEMLDDERDYNESLKDKTPKEKSKYCETCDNTKLISLPYNGSMECYDCKDEVKQEIEKL